MSTSTVALTIEMPSLDASLSWNALESLVVGMSHEVPARALALALDDAQERLLQEACGPRWAPVRGLLAPFACPGCGAREDFARKGKRTRPRTPGTRTARAGPAPAPTAARTPPAAAAPARRPGPAPTPGPAPRATCPPPATPTRSTTRTHRARASRSSGRQYW